MSTSLMARERFPATLVSRLQSAKGTPMKHRTNPVTTRTARTILRPLLALPLVATLVWAGAPPARAAGESWVVTDVLSVGCGSPGWSLDTTWSGLDGSDYIAHTVVSSGGLTYMNEEAHRASDGTRAWTLYGIASYGPTTGTFPIPPGQPMHVQLTLERPKGTVISSWTLATASCDSPQLLYNGPTAADVDEDFLATPTDLCPSLASSSANGCPLHDRTLTLKARNGPKRVVGKLYAAGYPDLSVGRTVQVWKKKPGPDRIVAIRTTNGLGKFKAKVGKGRYYATSPSFVAPTSGEALADISNRVRVR